MTQLDVTAVQGMDGHWTVTLHRGGVPAVASARHRLAVADVAAGLALLFGEGDAELNITYRTARRGTVKKMRET